jgi:RNA polymerase subunit RPABC4/transcription elongation factor Spt4
MKTVIHGSSNGYRIITSDQNVVGLLDATPDSHKVAAIGQQAYSVNFSGGKVIFSKYRIVRDALKHMTTGNVAVSVIIQNAQRLAGGDVRAMLDELAESFGEKYVKRNNLVAIDDSETWDFVANIEKRYKPKLEDNAETIANITRRGQRDAAFAYYSSGEELQKYLDAPYRKEYSPYAQIFFIDEELDGKSSNPLNALRNSGDDLTGKVDFSLPSFPLPSSVIEDSPPEPPAQFEPPDTFEPPKPPEPPKPFDLPKPFDQPKPWDKPMQFDQSKQFERPKPSELPKPLDPPKPLNLSRPSDRLKPSELPKPFDSPKPPEPPKNMICSACGAVMPAHNKFCNACGSTTLHVQTSPAGSAATVVCRMCKAAMSASDAFCTICGAKGSASAPKGATKACGRCGTLISVGDVFCPSCGKSA